MLRSLGSVPSPGRSVWARRISRLLAAVQPSFSVTVLVTARAMTVHSMLAQTDAVLSLGPAQIVSACRDEARFPLAAPFRNHWAVTLGTDCKSYLPGVCHNVPQSCKWAAEPPGQVFEV